MAATAHHPNITLSDRAIHNPDDPRHFMRIKPVAGHVRVLCDGRVLAASDDALRLLEVGRDFYDPVFYLPLSDVQATLLEADKHTRCPLKGEASYFHLASATGAVEVAEIAWCYRSTLELAHELEGRVAFYASKVVVEEHPAPGNG